MAERIKPSDEIFKRAVARGDRAQIEAWDSDGMIEWHEKNHIGRKLSEEAQRKRQAETETETDREEPTTEPSRVDRMVGKDERLSHSHPLVQGAIRRGDSALLAELLADSRHESAPGSGPFGSFTYADIEARHRKDAS